jgi:hypothetical protein
VPPVIAALDANHDGIIDASEIATRPPRSKPWIKTTPASSPSRSSSARLPAVARPAPLKEAKVDLAVKAAREAPAAMMETTKAAPAVSKASKTMARRHPRPASNQVAIN